MLSLEFSSVGRSGSAGTALRLTWQRKEWKLNIRRLSGSHRNCLPLEKLSSGIGSLNSRVTIGICFSLCGIRQNRRKNRCYCITRTSIFPSASLNRKCFPCSSVHCETNGLLPSLNKTSSMVRIPHFRADDYMTSTLTQIASFLIVSVRLKPFHFATKFRACRFSTLTEMSSDVLMQESPFIFIKSTLSKIEGPNYRWLNRGKSTTEVLSEAGVCLLIVGAFLKSSLLSHHDQVDMIEKAKLLQQRYPKLQVFGVEHSNSDCSTATESSLVKIILEEYITFPILLLEREFTEITKQPCYFLFESFEAPFRQHDWNVDTSTIVTEIEEFSLLPYFNSAPIKELNSYGIRKSGLAKGPYVCPSLRNLVLHYPGCVTADNCRNRLFVSDSNHHRIIVTDSDGKIVDCIGSSQGFEDGEFEYAELTRPAGSIYDVNEDCLYFVDCENHAVRRADMKGRVVETIYPVHGSKTGGIWNWIMEKLGRRKVVPDSESNLLTFPWHMMKLNENDFQIFDRRFKTSWILRKATGKIESVCMALPHNMEAYNDMILPKVCSHRELIGNWLQQRAYAGGSSEAYPCASLCSTLTEINDAIIFCDTAGQVLLKYDQASRSTRNIQFSQMEMLGIPYWLTFPTEKVIPSTDTSASGDPYLQQFNVLPGRCKIHVNIDIPEGTELAAPVNEEFIWRQVRGSAAEITRQENDKLVEKVGVAQQWYDELDTLAFSESIEDPGKENEDLSENTHHHHPDQEGMVHINCTVKTSPGTSEVIISVALYLKVIIKSLYPSSGDEWDKENTFRVLNNHFKVPGDDASINLLQQSSGMDDLIKDLLFVRPVHVRIRLECADHPLCPKSREIISTDSNFEVNISL